VASPTESIRFAVVRWNRETRQAQAVVVEETKTLVNGCAVLTVKQSAGRVEDVTQTGGWEVLVHFERLLGINAESIALVRVDHGL
jgi:hypothetical protein